MNKIYYPAVKQKEEKAIKIKCKVSEKDSFIEIEKGLINDSKQFMSDEELRETIRSLTSKDKEVAKNTKSDWEPRYELFL